MSFMFFNLLFKKVTHIEMKVWGKATETAVDIVLGILENSQGNICCEVLSKVTASQHRIR